MKKLQNTRASETGLEGLTTILAAPTVEDALFIPPAGRKEKEDG